MRYWLSQHHVSAIRFPSFDNGQLLRQLSVLKEARNPQCCSYIVTLLCTLWYLGTKVSAVVIVLYFSIYLAFSPSSYLVRIVLSHLSLSELVLLNNIMPPDYRADIILSQ